MGAIALGVAFLLVPALITSPIVRTMVLGLKTPGWLAILAGVALLMLHRVTDSFRAASGTQTCETPRARESQSRPERVEPSGGPLIADAAQAQAAISHRNDGDAPPIPTAWSAEVFDLIEWRRFEALCEWLFKQAGFDTKTQSHGADGGIDIWLYSRNYPDGPVSVVQCKCWSKTPVKVAEVRQLLGSMADKKVKRGIFATTSTFTHDARQLAKDNAIQLLDRTALLEVIAKRTAVQQAELLCVATKDEFWKPTCPSCGVKMTRRAAKKSDKRFWGCVNFPSCTTVING
jgi:restriction system protein